MTIPSTPAPNSHTTATAATTDRPPWIKTPCLASASLSSAAGCHVYAKLDLLQPSGSFKIRGIGNLIWQRVQEFGDATHPLHFYSSSRGNAGLAAATAAKRLGQRATVVVPETTEVKIKARIEAAGAEVVVHGVSLSEADELAQALVAARENAVHVPPFDHELIWEGNATIVDEIFEDWEGPPPDAIVCSVGGGGLMNGLMRGLDRYGWGESVAVLALETEGADCLSRSLQAGGQVTMREITSIAKSLGVARVSDKTWEWVQRRPKIRSVVLHDADAARACVRFAEEERMIVEPACGVSLALLYDGLLEELIPGFGPESRVVVIVCGGKKGRPCSDMRKLDRFNANIAAGSNIDVGKLFEYEVEYGRVETKGSTPRSAVTVDGVKRVHGLRKA